MLAKARAKQLAIDSAKANAKTALTGYGFAWLPLQLP